VVTRDEAFSGTIGFAVVLAFQKRMQAKAIAKRLAKNMIIGRYELVRLTILRLAAIASATYIANKNNMVRKTGNLKASLIRWHMFKV